MSSMPSRRHILATGLATSLWLAGCAPGRAPTDSRLWMPPALPLDRTLTKIAFGSCIDESVAPQPVWDGVLADRPDLFVFGGDNIYASQEPWSQAVTEAAYARLGDLPNLAQLRRTVPHLAIWDDHDYGVNDGDARFPHKAASKVSFLDFWRAPKDDVRRAREGIYDAHTFGPPGRRVQIVLLDTRWFRSPFKVTDQRGAPGKERYVPDGDPGKTMLGDAQWRWFEAELRKPADLRLIVSGIQVIPRGHGWEHWGNLPVEQQRLKDLIRSTGAGGVVLLSGDRHIGAIYRETEGAAYPLHEITSSGITHPWAAAKEAGPNRLGDLVNVRHYGTVEVDWPTRRVRLALKNERAEVVREHAVSLDEMRPR